MPAAIDVESPEIGTVATMNINQLSVLAGWAALGLLFTGIGLLIRRACGRPAEAVDELFTAFWMGWCGSVLILQIWHFFLPIQTPARVLISALGLLGLAAGGLKPWKALGLGSIRLKNLTPLLALCLVAYVLSERALGGAQNGDSPMYHFPVMRWYEQYAVVKGLGNLFSAFAFNQSYFFYGAILDIGPFRDNVNHLANGIFLLVLLGRMILAIARVLAKGAAAGPENLFYALCAPGVATLVFNLNLTSPSPDFPIFVLGIVLSAQVLRVAAGSEPSAFPDYDLLAVSMTAAVGITVKMSFAGIAVASVPLALLFAYLRQDRPRRLDYRNLLLVSIITAAAIGPWMMHSIMLSGYPLYPSAILPMPVQWRMPPALMQEAWSNVHMWSGAWYRTMWNFGYVIQFLISAGCDCRDILLPLGISLAGVAFLILHYLVRLIIRGKEKPSMIPIAILLPTIAALTFWFAGAPRPRFAGAVFWVMTAQIVLLCVERSPGGNAGNWTRRVVMLFMLSVAALPFFDGKPLLRHLNRFEIQQGPKLVEVQLPSGLVIYYPGLIGTCGMGPLPCTARPQPGLRLIRPDDMGAGFYIEGQSAPADQSGTDHLPDNGRN